MAFRGQPVVGAPAFATPTGAVHIGDAAVQGAGPAAASSQHQHAFPAPAAGYVTDVGSLLIDGALTAAAHADHAHRIQALLLAPGGAVDLSGIYSRRGAVGDGVQYVAVGGIDTQDGLSLGSAKATVAAAIAALPAGGGRIKVGAGIFTAAVAPVLPSNVILEGQGIDVTVLRTGAANVGALSYAGGASNITVRDLTVNGNRAGFPAGAGAGASCTGGLTGVVHERVKFTNGQAFSLFFDTTAGGYSRCNFLECTFEDSGGGWDTFGSGQLADSIILGCHFRNSTGQGWACTGAKSVQVVACDFEGPLGNGISLEPGSDVTIALCYFHNLSAGTIGIVCQQASATGWPDCQNVTIVACLVENTGVVAGNLADYGIVLRNTVMCKVIGCSIQRMGVAGVLLDAVVSVASSGNTSKFNIVDDCIISDVNQRNTGGAAPVVLQQVVGASNQHNQVRGSVLARLNADSFSAAAILESGTVDLGQYEGNDITGHLTGGTITFATSTSRARNNLGHNPVGHAVTQPAIAASGTAVTNTTHADCTVHIIGGTVTAVAIGGTATGATSGAFRVPAGQTITLTYSAAPTWQWFGD